MKKLIIAVVAIGAIAITSCNKNQKAVATIAGDWEEVAVDGEPIPDSARGTMHFDECKLKKEEWCTAEYTDSEGTSTGVFDYKIVDKGKGMTQKISDPSKGSIEITGTIDELTDSKLVLTMSLFGASTTTEFSKK